MPQPPAGTITFLFTDIEGSTRLWERHPGPMEVALVRHDDLAAALIARHDGRLVKQRGEGDSLFAVFSSPRAALACAVALQQAFLAERWPADLSLRVRLALHTGEAVVRAGDYLGAAVNRCARLRNVGHGGQVLLSQAIRDRVLGVLPEGISLRDLGSHRLKDLQQPEHVFQLLHPALPADFPPLRSLEAFAHNLPAQLTRFIGRENEMAEVKRLMAGARLLTLTGAGGCGKTRLALQVAADLLEEYADGAWLVELAALSDPSRVPQAAASALGVREQPARALIETLTDSLSPRSLLLVLDNCEHLLGAGAQLADGLLRGCRELRILATSREGLGIAGEQTFRVPSLSLPERDRLPNPERLDESESVRLFVDRALLSQASFALTPDNAPAVAQICQRLDGIPLAIELAAVWVKMLTVQQIAARLDDQFRLLTGGSRTSLARQQTLRATMDWSYDLLTEAEGTLFRRLSVFAGGWSLTAAQAVCSGEGLESEAILVLLSRLVDKSLVLVEEGGDAEARYRFLGPVRQYGEERLLEARGSEVRRERHRDWFLELAERAEPELKGPTQAAWLGQLLREHDNLRAALAWTEAAGEGKAGLRLGGALGGFWRGSGHLSEGREWLAKLLALTPEVPPTSNRAKVLIAAGWLAYGESDYPMARAHLEEGLRSARELGDRANIAQALIGLGDVDRQQGDFDSARACFQECLIVARAMDDPHSIALALASLGNAAEHQGDYGTARSLLEQALAIHRKLGDGGSVAQSLDNLGMVAQREGDLARARALHEERLSIQRGLNSRPSLNLVADVALLQGDLARARELHQESLRDARERSDPSSIAWSLNRLGMMARDQGDLEKAQALYEEALSLGRAMGKKQFIAWSLSDLGVVALYEGDSAAARRYVEESLALRREQGDRRGIATSLLNLGLVAQQEEDEEAAQARIEESLAMFREIGDRRATASALCALGNLTLHRAQTACARALLAESLAIERTVGNKRRLAECLESLAQVWQAESQIERAVRLYGTAAALRSAAGTPLPAVQRDGHEHQIAIARGALGEAAFAAAWAEGQAIPAEQAIDKVLEGAGAEGRQDPA